MVVENHDLAEVGHRYSEQKMGPPKSLRGLIPLPGARLKSRVEVVAPEPVDQPYVEPPEKILSPLQGVGPTEAELVTALERVALINLLKLSLILSMLLLLSLAPP